ncbi:unnamed protein product [marine sediment metagenome]|uniref:Uncharacterized protein n=1 Tax=marine sediment metagenome TaxID=412755 RepID=X1SJ58_9ZZZZ
MKQFKAILNLETKKQVDTLLDKTIKVREKSFIKDFWIPITLYNEARQLRNEVKGLFLIKWVATLDQFLEGKPINEIEASKLSLRLRG